MTKARPEKQTKKIDFGAKYGLYSVKIWKYIPHPMAAETLELFSQGADVTWKALPQLGLSHPRSIFGDHRFKVGLITNLPYTLFEAIHQHPQDVELQIPQENGDAPLVFHMDLKKWVPVDEVTYDIRRSSFVTASLVRHINER